MQEADPIPPPQEKSEEQLLEEKKQLEQQEKQKQQERKRLLEEARQKEIEDMKKLEEACKGALSGLSKTADNRSMAYSKLTLSQKELEKLFPSILQHSEIRYLDLSGNALLDIAVLLDFDHLVSLNLSKNQIPDLCSFNSDRLAELQFLNLGTNKIKVLSKITLPALRKLCLNENQIAVMDWSGHQTIEILELRKNKLKKLKGLGNMKQLKELYVAENQITDMRGIENVPNLEKLSLRNNKIKIIMNPFPFMPALKHLNLRENQIASIKELEKIDDHIKSVNFMANPLADELGENAKREMAFTLPHYLRINKSDITLEDRIQFEKEWLQRLAEKEKLEKQAAEEEARKAAEEGKAED